ncbi:MAG: hypothetical protein K9N47_01080 [Prosthecobacter sp.]|uniref:CHC2 zinc finger domain-containing protein n=1 Tax=Prosthecobacter sp. TaxID=1965333 RepID=UPI0025F24D1A|nr:CHC2 zinc finger domain-containing protein [Prosthecobacter sp.]MCF7784680.1 hypothetical protein [Prosthecobacter sp.]
MTTTAPTHNAPTRREHHDIPALKERLLIPEVWQKLNLEGQPGASCRSPFRPDKNPSFSITKNGQRWKDFGTGQGGDVIDFIAMARQISTAQALRVFLELAGVPMKAPGHAPRAASSRRTSFKEKVTALLPPQEPPKPEGLCVPLQNGTEAERRLVAESRRITPEAVSLALALRTLTFSIVQGFRCWLLVDAEERVVEARRLDGMPFTACGTLGRRKAHTLRGSRKNWPLGAAVLRRIPQFRTLLLVEGGPDYLAALHFAHELERWDVLPVAMLGRAARGHAGARHGRADRPRGAGAHARPPRANLPACRCGRRRCQKRPPVGQPAR